MRKNQNLLIVREVAEILGVSALNVRRWLHEAKSGQGSFPSPVFGNGEKPYSTDQKSSWKEIVEPGASGRAGGEGVRY